MDIQSVLFSCCIGPGMSNSQIYKAKKLWKKLICFRTNHADDYIKDIMSKKQIQVLYFVLCVLFVYRQSKNWM